MHVKEQIRICDKINDLPTALLHGPLREELSVVSVFNRHKVARLDDVVVAIHVQLSLRPRVASRFQLDGRDDFVPFIR